MSTTFLRAFGRRLRRVRGGDDGFAMVTVLGICLIMTALVIGSLTYASQVRPQARHDQDWNAALAAAQSGVDDYVAKLNQNDSYWTTVDCTNVALKGPKAGTNTCGWTTATPAGLAAARSPATRRRAASTTTWTRRPSTRRGHPGHVHGQGAQRRRARIQVLVPVVAPTQFLYYTDFEDADPANQFAYPSGAPNNTCGLAGPTQRQVLVRHGTPTRHAASGCVEITFVVGRRPERQGALQRHALMLRRGRDVQAGLRDGGPQAAPTRRTSSTQLRALDKRGRRTISAGYKATYAGTASTCRTTATSSPTTPAASTPATPGSASTPTAR